MTSRLLIIGVIAGGLGFGRSAGAANANRIIHANVTSGFATMLLSQRSNETWTITTSNLSAGSDTVIHVQSYDGASYGQFIAGNDDFLPGQLASQVIVAGSSAVRNLFVIVRAYSSGGAGTCAVTATSSMGASMSYPIVNFGGTRYDAGTLPVGSHITTAQEPGGTDDTVLLAVTGTFPAHAAMYDDDLGVDFMSFIRLPEDCPSCQIVVGNFDPATGSTATTLVWDPEAETNDMDHDGLGSSLESVIGTLDSNIDSDADGIRDDYELYGNEIAGGHSLLFPLMGADPSKKDLFIEVDWLACTGCTNLDGNQMTAANAAAWVADFLPVRVHMDTGLTNTDPATWTSWNNWGGAERVTTETVPYCDGFSPERKHFFHHYLSDGLNGGQTAGSTDCSAGNQYDRQGAHEMGHQHYLQHGGRPYVGNFNSKPQYRSMMNYGFEFDLTNAPSFSHGDAPVQFLNPVALNEQAGIGTTNQAWLNALQAVGYFYPYKVDMVHGYIDWDRDGEFSATPTRAAIEVSPVVALGTVGWTRFNPTETFRDPALAWQSLGGSIGDRLVLFGRGASSKLEYMTVPRSSIDTLCGTFTSLNEGESSNCANLNGDVRKAGPTTAAIFSAPAVADLGGAKLLVAYGDANGHPMSSILTTNNVSGVESWSAPITLPGSQTITGDMTALSVPAGIWVFAPTTSGLKKWTYANGSWSAPSSEKWSNGSSVDARYGVGATMGYQDGTSQIYLATPVASPADQLEVAQFNSSNGRWTKMTSTWQTRYTTRARPFIVYERKAGQAVTVGRFYLGYTPIQSGIPSISMVAMTEGNLAMSTTTKRFLWLSPVQLTGNVASSGLTATFAPTWDTSFHAALSYLHTDGTTHIGAFIPIGDGIPNMPIGDLNDFAYITGAQRASLGYENLPLP